MKALRILQLSLSLVLVFCVITFAQGSGTVTSTSYIPFGNYTGSVGASHTEYAVIQTGTNISWALRVIARITPGYVSVEAGIGAPVNDWLTRTGYVENEVYKGGSKTITSTCTIPIVTSITTYFAYGWASSSATLSW
jgi:hypothetical protein